MFGLRVVGGICKNCSRREAASLSFVIDNCFGLDFETRFEVKMET